MPVSVQHLQDELVQDVLTAACALRDLCQEKPEQDGGHGDARKQMTPRILGASLFPFV